MHLVFISYASFIDLIHIFVLPQANTALNETRPHNRLLFNITSVLYIVMAVVHIVFHFAKKPALDTVQKQTLFDLMNNYRFDWGSGVMRSMTEVQEAFALYVSILLLGMAILNLIIIRHSKSERLMMHTITLNFIVMVFMAGISIWKAFLIPMIIYGSCFVFIAVPFFRQLTKPVK